MKKTAFQRLACTLLCLTLAAFAPAALAQEAPNATDVLKTYTELDLTPYLGKTVFLNFFTEWCYYCMQEMPDVKKLPETYSEDDLAVVLVHVWDGETAANTESVKERFQMQDMTFFEDEDRAVASVVGLQGYPATLFIAPDGTLVGAQSGMLTWEQMTAQLDGMGVSRREEAP